MKKKILNLLAMLLTAWPFLFAQQPLIDSFPEERARAIMNVLAGDSLRGRGNGTEDLLKAARFIMNEFRQAGLKPLPGFGNLFHEFYPYPPAKKISAEQLQWNEQDISQDDFIYLPVEPGAFEIKELGSFSVIHLDSLSAGTLISYNDSLADLLLWTESAIDFEKLSLPREGLSGARLLVRADEPPRSLRLTADTKHFKSVEYNIVGILPGKTRPQECIVFSSHYDHMGIRKGKDSILNGANDNASGTTALIMLARYFTLRNDNARTLIFCAFAGEELGLKGSSEMVDLFNLSALKAGINLEMLGWPQYGKKKVFITGQRNSSLPAILRKGLSRSGLRVIREPSEENMLFARSDNYPFVLKGVAFHTIMASDDSEPCYHSPCDEIKRMDFPNLCFITRAIASACAGLISGEETPGEVTIPVWR